MEQAILITTCLLAGGSIGALLAHARDRRLLRLYGHLVREFSRMVPRPDASPPEPPTTAARASELQPACDSPQRVAS